MAAPLLYIEMSSVTSTGTSAGGTSASRAGGTSAGGQSYKQELKP